MRPFIKANGPGLQPRPISIIMDKSKLQTPSQPTYLRRHCPPSTCSGWASSQAQYLSPMGKPKKKNPISFNWQILESHFYLRNLNPYPIGSVSKTLEKPLVIILNDFQDTLHQLLLILGSKMSDINFILNNLPLLITCFSIPFLI